MYALYPANIFGMRTLIFESYGNNEIRLGWDNLPVRAKCDNDSANTRANESIGRVAVADHERYLSDNGLLELRDKDGVLYVGNSKAGYERVECDLSKLDIIHEFQRESDRSTPDSRRGYGEAVRPTRFTRGARHRILEAGSLFDKTLADTHRGYFVTFTLPGSRPEAYDAISRWSGYLVNVVLQCLRRFHKGAYWFYCWELQKRGALHLHLFCALPRGTEVNVLNGRLRDVWYRALGYVQDKSGCDVFGHQRGDYCTASEFWQYDFQEVKTTPAQYISKYLGKGALAPASKGELDSGQVCYYPHRWHGMSRSFKKLVDENRFRACMDAMTKEDCQHVCNAMAEYLEEFEPVASQVYTAEIGSGRDEGVVIGVSHRRIYWFSADIFEEVDLMFRKMAIAWMRTKPSHLQRWRYNSVNYKGCPVGEL